MASKSTRTPAAAVLAGGVSRHVYERPARVTADARRRDAVLDTDWSEVGSTWGTPDRWQWRDLTGLYLTVGNNHREPGAVEFVVPESETPWKVYAWKPNDKAPGQLDLVLVASGTAVSSAAAREAAENAAQDWTPATARLAGEGE